MSSGLTPALKLSMIADTGMRVPLMMGTPDTLPGTTSMSVFMGKILARKSLFVRFFRIQRRRRCIWPNCHFRPEPEQPPPPSYKFEISGAEKVRLDEWLQTHACPTLTDEGMIPFGGWGFEYTFRPMGFTTAITVRCCKCGSESDVSDWENA